MSKLSNIKQIENASLKVLHDKKHSKKSKTKRGEALTMKSKEIDDDKKTIATFGLHSRMFESS